MLSFEKIRDLERAERENKFLQKLPENVVEEIKDYISRKEKTSSELEMKNIKAVIKSFFEMREKKLLESVVYALRTNMPIENLTPKEEALFSKMFSAARSFREDLFGELQKPAALPVIEKKAYAYKVKRNVENIVGPDMKQYSLRENEIMPIESIPKPLNDLLLKQGIIERIEVNV